MENPDATQHYLDQADNQLRHIDRLPIFVADFIKDYVEKYKLNITDQEIMDAMGSIYDALSDMTYEARHELESTVGWDIRPNIFELMKSVVKSYDRVRTNPASYKEGFL